MRIITFTSDDRRALAHDRYHHPDPRVQRKMEVLWLKSHGLNHDDIAAYAAVHRSQVYSYLDEYIEGGRSRLRRACWRCAGRSRVRVDYADRRARGRRRRDTPAAGATQARCETSENHSLACRRPLWRRRPRGRGETARCRSRPDNAVARRDGARKRGTRRASRHEWRQRDRSRHAAR